MVGEGLLRAPGVLSTATEAIAMVTRRSDTPTHLSHRGVLNSVRNEPDHGLTLILEVPPTESPDVLPISCD